ncbi:MAG TPA: hypothetical protein PLT09_07060 [Deltaproteobacteria bacterium]|nr:hypothetical protein [Deltaproteobacteria bacterium]HPR53667.1 hypothetical protein [Deltaproteobacteria bacterium]HXK47183.1 hypothetical protein [Deltaproteobacteria bacterium]
MASLHICKACWLISTPGYRVKGSLRTEVALWLLMVVPGIVYTLWRHITREKICPACASMAVVPIDSSLGWRFFSDLYSKRNTRFIGKVLDYRQEDFIRTGAGHHALPPA